MTRAPPQLAVERLLLNSQPRSGTRFVVAVLARLLGLVDVPTRFTGGFRATPPHWNPYDEDRSYESLQPGQALHGHYPLGPALEEAMACGLRVIYLHRDPRDACVSAALFIKHRSAQHPFHELFSALDERECITLMLAGFRLPVAALPYKPPTGPAPYVEFEGMRYFTRRSLCWLVRPGVGRLRYEDLVLDPATALRAALDEAGIAHDPGRLLALSRELDFEHHSGGRSSGEEDKTSHYRKGIVGDWRNYFTSAHMALARRAIGDDLVALGYEKDHCW